MQVLGRSHEVHGSVAAHRGDAGKNNRPAASIHVSFRRRDRNQPINLTVVPGIVTLGSVDLVVAPVAYHQIAQGGVEIQVKGMFWSKVETARLSSGLPISRTLRPRKETSGAVRSGRI